jgi:hypothetical protein
MYERKETANGISFILKKPNNLPKFLIVDEASMVNNKMY